MTINSLINQFNSVWNSAISIVDKYIYYVLISKKIKSDISLNA